MSLLWTIVILVAVNVATIAAMLLVRRRAPEGSYFKDGDRASGVFGVLAGGFAIFAGFIIFLAFTSYDQSRSGGEAEALTVRPAVRDRAVLPPAVRDRLTRRDHLLRALGRAPGVAADGGRARAATRSTPGRRPLPQPEARGPVNATEQAAYGKWLDQTSDREEARRDRLHGAEGIIPASIWLVLFLIAGVVFAFMLFFADSGEGAALAGDADGLGDHGDRADAAGDQRARQPYRDGSGQIKPVAMERSLRVLDSARAAVNDTARCRATPAAPGLVLMEEARPGRSTATSSSRRPCCSRWRRWQRPGRPTRSARWHGEQARAQSARSPPASSRRARRTWRTASADRRRAVHAVGGRLRARRDRARRLLPQALSPRVPARVQGWVATKPRKNPAPRCRPSRCPSTSSRRTPRPIARGQAAAPSVRVGRFIQRADNYSLAVVLFAAPLFFAGISTRLHARRADGRARARLRAVPGQRDLDRDVPGQRVGVESRPPQGEAAQNTLRHCSALPLPLAVLPPASVTPATASMPKSKLLSARLSRSRVPQRVRRCRRRRGPRRGCPAGACRR